MGYAHEHESLYAETGVLKTALKAIVDAYDEMPKGMAAGEWQQQTPGNERCDPGQSGSGVFS